MSSITKMYGFYDYKTIYDHPQNAEFKQKNPNPNTLCRDDVLFIPDKELKEESGSTEQQHNFKVKQPKTFIHLIIKNSEGKPYANVDYKATIGSKKIKGKIGSDGKIKQKIPADAISGEIILYSKTGSEQIIGVIPLEIGFLHPVERDSGVQARLNNLGFDCGNVDGVIGAKTKAAIRAFQHKNGLTETGDADEATRDKLRQAHDWE